MPPRRPARAVALNLLAAGLVAAVPAAAEVPVLSPLARSCQGCHQPTVNAATMPALGRYPATEIAAKLRAARDQPEPGSIMARFAQQLGDAEIEALAAELGRPASPGSAP